MPVSCVLRRGLRGALEVFLHDGQRVIEPGLEGLEDVLLDLDLRVLVLRNEAVDPLDAGRLLVILREDPAALDPVEGADDGGVVQLSARV